MRLVLVGCQTLTQLTNHPLGHSFVIGLLLCYNTDILVLQVWHLHKENNLMGLVDPKLHLRPDEETEARRVLEVALMCIQISVEKRPTMFSVVSMLLGDSEISVNVDDSSTWLDLDYHPQLRMLEGGSPRSSSRLVCSSSNSHSPRLLRSKKNSIATLELSDLGGR